jgi:hypothetical protein
VYAQLAKDYPLPRTGTNATPVINILKAREEIRFCPARHKPARHSYRPSILVPLAGLPGGRSLPVPYGVTFGSFQVDCT